MTGEHQEAHDQDRENRAGISPEDIAEPDRKPRGRRPLARIAIVVGGLAAIGLAAVAGYGVISSGVADLASGYGYGDDAEGPSLESRLQQQQQTLDQLRDRLDTLEAERASDVALGRNVDARLDRLAEHVEANAQMKQRLDHLASADEVDGLSQRIDELSGSVDVRFSAVRETEQGLEASIDALRERLEKRKAKPRQDQASRSRRKSPTPPFTIAGVERRGDRRFLAIADGEVASLSDLRLIRAGQSVGRWRLSSIDGRSASFTVDGRDVVVSLP
ncbi:MULTISPECIES: hypothetical protein [unclassified Modicisalibacter]|uniref:hypothetical protein n=1 Tax=unclassified Modicisalibacter TaxID=2679913 RepID=UPI001CCE04B5|nr:MULTISPECIES: hypothetical protein [unclassified Modicisalibacter]MBZ9559051.1 hypothetical protein [Modicisalibacter sp. R2A 31.J]MBZ9576838.1 hypothetical protein [Modicisalibacter sp. MOD 31.J]